MSRRAYVDHNKKLILYWSPKAGCTSLVHWFIYGALDQKPGFLKETQYRDPRTWLREKGYQVDHLVARGMVERCGYKSVVVARHPATRALSAYLNKFVRYHNKPLNHPRKLEQVARHSYKLWKNLPQLQPISNYVGLSFMEFLEAVRAEVRRARVEGGEPRTNIHWNTQIPFVYAQDGFSYDQVFYLEAFGEAIAWLNSEYGRAEQVCRMNVTDYGSAKMPDAAHVSSLELCDHPDWLALENFLTGDTLPVIEETYAVDFEYFGYDPRDCSVLPQRSEV